ncbi:MAG: phosphate ABC transporter substrate-binding protein [Alteromonadaceae bacterium]|nr:MAG: phosphate ABC transporter substrate-binding protein [Alteromonadaceae bacterium]
MVLSSLILCGILFIKNSYAETSVIVHPSNGNSLTAKAIQRIFLSKMKTFPDGDVILPIDQPLETDIRKNFIKVILKKRESQMSAYWASVVFTGKGLPPKQVEDGKSVKNLVAKNPNTIGYIDSSKVDDSVKVVHSF